MLALLDALFQIVMRRRGPEDLPDSAFLLGLLLAAYALVQLPTAVMVFGRAGVGLAAVLVDCLLLAGCFWLLLQWTGHAPRYRQTLAALAGTGALFATAQLPLVYLARLSAIEGQPAAGPTLGLLLLLLWSIVVQAHITARALSASFGLGLGLALVYFVLSYQVSGFFLPQAG